MEKLPDDDCYAKVFATRNYGHLLAKSEATRLEGNDYIKRADSMQLNYPHWSERRMNLFVPVMAIDDSVFEIM